MAHISYTALSPKDSGWPFVTWCAMPHIQLSELQDYVDSGTAWTSALTRRPPPPPPPYGGNTTGQTSATIADYAFSSRSLMASPVICPTSSTSRLSPVLQPRHIRPPWRRRLRQPPEAPRRRPSCGTRTMDPRRSFADHDESGVTTIGSSSVTASTLSESMSGHDALRSSRA